MALSNVKVERKGNILCLFIDMSEDKQKAAPLSKSEKTRVLASTHGFTSVEGVDISLNCTIGK